jgi:DNA repair photolyase
MAKVEQPTLFEHATGTKPGGAYPAAGGVTVREVECRTVLNHSPIGDYSLNCYTGCVHACVYCYARFMQRFHPHTEPWGKFVDVKVNAAEVLARQLRRLPPGEVFISSACDGWQPLERRYRLTRRCAELLLEAGFTLSILTKSELVLRDLDILASQNVRLGVTITTPDETLARRWEPKASSVAGRLRILREAKAAGLRTSMSIGPLLPGLSDTPEALGRLFEMAAEAQVDHVWTDVLNPRPRAWPAVEALVRRCWPSLLPLYRKVLFDASFRASYEAEVGERVRRAAAAAEHKTTSHGTA